MKFDWKRLLPQYWIQNSPTDWDWDATLNDILDNAKSIQVGPFTSDIDGISIWTSNWPYAYGSFYIYRNTKSGLPSIKTRHRLRGVIEAARRKKLQEAIEKLRNK